MDKLIKWSFLFVVSSFTSCILPSEDSLFENGEQTIVIEGRLTNSDKIQNGVNVSMSVNGDSEKNFEPVNNALVQIVNNKTNERVTLELTEDGKYLMENQIGIPGDGYNLEVFNDGLLYKATEQMPSIPNISSVLIAYQNKEPFIPGFYIYFTLKKRIDTVGFYKIEINVDDSNLNGYSDLIVFEDRLYNNIQLYKIPVPFKRRDTIDVRIYALSENIYEYYMGLSKQSTNLFSNIQPPSTNPNNNIQPEALGYFQVSSVYIIDTVIPSLQE